MRLKLRLRLVGDFKNVSRIFPEFEINEVSGVEVNNKTI